MDPQLWTRLEDAKRRLDASHGATTKAKDSHTLEAEEEAAEEFIQALRALHPTDSTLTPREREVLTMIAAGKSSKEVATHLGIAVKTVVTHRYKIYRKLKIHKTVDLVKAAIRMGLV